MAKQLRLNKMDSHGSLTVKELTAWLASFPETEPVVLLCGKNFRLGKMVNKSGKPVLVGKRNVLK